MYTIVDMGVGPSFREARSSVVVVIWVQEGRFQLGICK